MVRYGILCITKESFLGGHALKCSNCSTELKKDWKYCPNCSSSSQNPVSLNNKIHPFKAFAILFGMIFLFIAFIAPPSSSSDTKPNPIKETKQSVVTTKILNSTILMGSTKTLLSIALKHEDAKDHDAVVRMAVNNEIQILTKGTKIRMLYAGLSESYIEVLNGEFAGLRGYILSKDF